MSHLTLLVDDDEAIRRLLTEYFDIMGLQTACASDGQEALELLDKLNPAVVVTDVDMPMMNGLDLIKALQERQTSIPVIAISGNFAHLVAADNLGAVSTFVKPLDLSGLVAEVKRLLG
ncbi:MAG: response regulator [Chromatiales bacterium]|nr:response regulator [Chromatiales bacterium]